MSDHGPKDHTSRLATILVADVVGYSRSMEVDEDWTYATLRALREEVIEPGTESHGGRIVKHLGDGFLAEFPTVMAGMQFAIALQNEIRRRNREIPEERRLRLRIGVNLGDVIVDDVGDVFGDGVNVAARLEALALPGGVCVSGAVRDSVHKRLEAEFEDLGEQAVKNIPTPVRAWHVHWSEESPFGRAQRGRTRSFIAELNRRNVLRVAVAYLAAAWLLTEVVSTLFPIFGVPDWGVRLVVLCLAAGFLPAVFISWAFELTPDGLKREADVVRKPGQDPGSAKRLDRVTIGLLVAAIAYVTAMHFWAPSSPREAGGRPAVEASAPVELDKSVAVLPFVNMSADPGNEHFSDGISEELIHLLATIPDLRVIARTSAFSYKNRSVRIAQVAEELNVAHVLEGSVRKAGDRVRITAQLVDAASEERLWSEVFERQLTAANVFVIQSEIAEAISSNLRAVLSPAQRQRLRENPTENLAAYEQFLLGRQHLAQGHSSDMLEAIEHLREAVALDPRFAMAWAALSQAYVETWYRGEFLSLEESFEGARAAAQTALRLEPASSVAWVSLGRLKYHANDLEGAREDFEKALELNPNSASLREYYGSLLMELGLLEESLRMRAEAVELDPLSASLRREHAVALRTLGRTTEAMEELRMALEIDPRYPSAIDNIATIQWQVLDRMDEALKNYSRVIALDPASAMHPTFVGQIFLDLDQPGRAGEMIGRAERLAPDSRFTHMGLLLLALHGGATDRVASSARLLLENPIRASWVSALCAARLGWMAVEAGRFDDTLALYAEYYPDLFAADSPDIDWRNYRAAIDLAAMLRRLGDSERSERLLGAAADFIPQLPRLGWWGGYGVSDVQILVLQGRKAEALSALRQAADAGWRSLWWYYLRRDPILAPLHDEPAFQRVVNDIEDDVAEQMERVREMERSGEINLTVEAAATGA